MNKDEKTNFSAMVDTLKQLSPSNLLLIQTAAQVLKASQDIEKRGKTNDKYG
ncbi:MAG: hypothetical protein HFG44_04210 [Oscillospiraceae bacterium]|nr:hypothetical protein [Oscillospiraceae bacterium]